VAPKLGRVTIAIVWLHPVSPEIFLKK
jgi:hypothetical protein